MDDEDHIRGGGFVDDRASLDASTTCEEYAGDGISNLCVSETKRDCTQFVHHYRRPLAACGQRIVTRNRPPPPPARQTLLEQLPQDRSAL